VWPLAMALLFLVLLVVIISSSLLTGKFTPWSLAPIHYRTNPATFLLYIAICSLVAAVLMVAMWRLWDSGLLGEFL